MAHLVILWSILAVIVAVQHHKTLSDIDDLQTEILNFAQTAVPAVPEAPPSDDTSLI